MITPVDLDEIPGIDRISRAGKQLGRNQSDIAAFLSGPYEAVAVDLRGRPSRSVQNALARICKKDGLPIVVLLRKNEVFLIRTDALDVRKSVYDEF